MHFLHRVLDELAGVVAVGNREVRAEAYEAGMTSKETVADAVERAAPDPPGLVTGDVAGALKHFRCGAVGERQEQNRIGGDSLVDEVGHAVDEGLRLARARRSEHQQRTAASCRRFVLLGVQDCV